MDERMRTQELLSCFGLVPNRALGQNFLADGAVIDAIVAAASPDGRTVLEVGPGLGALTRGLCARASRVVAVEKDAGLADALWETLGCGNLAVVTADFLEFDVAAHLGGEAFAAVGNLPYYVTTPIAEKLLTLSPDSITLMVQSEAAARFFAKPGERVYGPLCVLAERNYRCARVLEVPRTCFLPQPEVESTVLHLARRADALPDPAAFLAFLKRVFAMRRKTLHNNLAALGMDFDPAALGLPANVRAEALDPQTLERVFRTTTEQLERNR